MINNGFEELGIPPFAEIHLPDINLPVEWPMFAGNYNLSELTIAGISNFDATADLTINEHFEVIINYTFKLHELRVTSLYDFNSRLVGITDLIGTGNIDFKMAFDVEGVVLAVSDFTVTAIPTIDPKFVITGLSIGERMSGLVSKQMDNIIKGTINTDMFRKAFSELVGWLVKQLVSRNFEVRASWEEGIGIILKSCNIELELYENAQRLRDKQQVNLKTDL